MPITLRLGAHSESRVIINGATAATAVPTGDADRVATGEFTDARLFISWTGTVSALTLRVWHYDAGAWYRDVDITPTLANGAQTATFKPGKYAEFAIQVATLTGTAPFSVTVRVEGI